MLKALSSRKFKMIFMVTMLVLMVANVAFANVSNGNEFQSLYQRVFSWMTGIPAIVIALAFALIGVMRAFQSGSFIWALSGLLVAALVFLLPTIVTGMGGATI